MYLFNFTFQTFLANDFYYIEWFNIVFIEDIYLQNLSFLLYDKFYFTFLLCACLLLLAIIGSILITSQNTFNKEFLFNNNFFSDIVFLDILNSLKNTKKQNNFYQVTRKSVTKLFSLSFSFFVKI